jgi:YD repeat-containing protein
MKTFLVIVGAVVLGVTLAIAIGIWGGPLSSGALWLMRPPPTRYLANERPSSFTPLHQGHVDAATGLYIREDDDFSLTQSLPFALRRTYLSMYHVRKEFGIGTTSNAEWYLRGDPKTFQWAELILADGERIRFTRTSSGTSYSNALFIHRATPSDFFNAQLGWTGFQWGLRFWDGSLATFSDCGPGARSVCALTRLTDSYGRETRFNRDRDGLLRSIDTVSEHLRFEYDEQRRVGRIESGTGETVKYLYDVNGRLVQSRSSDGIVRAYSYGPHDEMLTIHEPGREIENTYDENLRVIRQVVHVNGQPPYIETFAYSLANGAVQQTAIGDNEGTRTELRFDDEHYESVELHQRAHGPAIVISFDRVGAVLRSLTVRCMRDGHHVTETVPFYANQIATIRDLISRACDGFVLFGKTGS